MLGRRLGTVTSHTFCQEEYSTYSAGVASLRPPDPTSMSRRHPVSQSTFSISFRRLLVPKGPVIGLFVRLREPDPHFQHPPLVGESPMAVWRPFNTLKIRAAVGVVYF